MGSYSWLNSKSRHPAKRNHPRGGALQTPLNKGLLDRPPVALVLLLSAPRSLDASTLAQTVGQTFGVEVASGEVGGPAFVAGFALLPAAPSRARLRRAQCGLSLFR